MGMENFQEDAEKNPKGATRSCGPAVSSQSVSTSGSLGSPSSHSETGMATPSGENAVLRLRHLEIHGDDAGFHGAVAGKKKKRGQHATGADKSGHGLRQFSRKVFASRTDYRHNVQVSDELVAEYAELSNAAGSNEHQGPGYDEKNIRRRVYDALNVLMAMDIISKDKKEIQWRGLPRTTLNDIEELKVIGYQSLVQRNQQLYGNGSTNSGGVDLPFILVQTRPNATVEVEISEDMQLVHFDFSSTPFELHDDNYVLKQMQICGKRQLDGRAGNPQPNPGEGSSMRTAYPTQISQPSPLPTGHQPPISTSSSLLDTFQHHIPLASSRANTSVRTPTSPPLPGILKARVQHDH
ncbi:hypothetical protein Cgig2_012772 [Carnegiea gigantea]|uniref:Transcription factor-like protein DPB n=1 Tax=Carnegiea gigantea TaxID=171969 RepID=A0A9Q1KA94_9CARY|nr:hypothetical protein Cgig2_012772 [Carnegiea gigantea]